MSDDEPQRTPQSERRARLGDRIAALFFGVLTILSVGGVIYSAHRIKPSSFHDTPVRAAISSSDSAEFKAKTQELMKVLRFQDTLWQPEPMKPKAVRNLQIRKP